MQYEGIIAKGNEEFVHHIEVFHCQVDPKVKVTSYNGPGMAEGKSPELEACREVIGAWAMGASVQPYFFKNIKNYLLTQKSFCQVNITS